MRTPLSRTAALAWWVTVGLGVLLRCTYRDVHSLWFDEAATLCAAQAADPLAVILQDRHPPLVTWLYRAWLALPWLGDDDAALRILPAAASCGSLLGGAALLRAWAPTTRQLPTLALLAVSPFLLWLAAEVRMYAFVDLATVIALLGVEQWRRQRTGCGLTLVFLGVAFGVGCHYMGALIGAAVAGVVGVEALDHAARRRCWQPLTAVAGGVAVWTPWLLHALPAQMATAWGWQDDHSLRALLELPARYVLVDASALEGPLRFGGAALGALLSLGAALQLAAALRRRAPADLRLVAAWLSPLLAALALWPVLTPHFSPRTLVAGAFGAVACIGVGLGHLPTRPLRGLAGAFAVVGCLTLVAVHRTGNRREDYRSATAEVIAAFTPGDRIVAVAGTPEVFAQHPLRHYLRQHPTLLAALVDGATATATDWPAGTRLHVVYRVAEYARPGLDRLTAGLATEFAGPTRFRVQYLRLRKT